MNLFPNTTTVNVNITEQFDPESFKKLEVLMSLATEKLNVIESKVDAVAVIVAELKAKLSEVLTPDEVAKFDAVIAKLEAVTAPAVVIE